MKTINIKNGPENVPVIIQGCMRMTDLSVSKAQEVIENAYECGINFFDHATCYGEGEAEKRFGDSLRQSHIRREDIILQSKCGIEIKRQVFDWSKENILNAADGILKRLGTDYLDILLLHRPDVLFEPEEVAEAFDLLYTAGKVKYFGVSNTVPMQIELLKKYVNRPLIINQLQLSLEQSQLIDQALYANNKTTEMSLNRDGNLLDYCRLNDITVQAWSPLQHGFFKGTFVDDPNFPELNSVLEELSDKYGVSKSAIAMAWILRHPAGMQAVAGTMNPEHLSSLAKGGDICLERDEWYRLYLSAGKFLP